jgi:hypothetical protein
VICRTRYEGRMYSNCIYNHLYPDFYLGNKKGSIGPGTYIHITTRETFVGEVWGILHLPEVHIGSMCPLPYTILICIKARGGCILLLQGCCQHKSLGKIGAWALVLSAYGEGIWSRSTLLVGALIYVCSHRYYRQ